jgi:hypothetical protein
MEASLRAVKAWPRDQIVVMHVEATGLDEKADEPVSIILLRPDGELLLDTRVKPRRHAAWPQAQDMHGIGPEDVADAPTLAQLRPKLETLVPRGTLLVDYDVDYDLALLKANGINWKTRDTFDIMLGFARAYGKPLGQDRHELPSLEEIVTHYGITGCGYGPRGDANKIAACFERLLADDTYADAKKVPFKQTALTFAIVILCLVLLGAGVWAVVTVPDAFINGDKDGMIVRVVVLVFAFIVFPILYGVGSERWH